MPRVIVPPVLVELDGAKVYILEVTQYTTPLGRKCFFVSCFIEIGDYRTHVFPVPACSNDELKAKLKAEIAKIKLVLMSGRTDLLIKKH